MLYRPRMALLLTVPNAGTAREKLLQGQSPEIVTLPVRVRRASWVYNDFNQADTLNVEGEYRDAGMDPRFLSAATGEFYLGDADPDTGQWSPSAKDLRFVGLMSRPARRASDAGFTISFEFKDYTTLFIETGKRFPAEGVPHYGEDLSEAWARICDHVGPVAQDGKTFSTVKALRERIRYIGLSEPPRLSGSVSKRLAKLGRLQVKPGMDAWAVWQHCVRILGLVSYIDRDEVVVTTGQDLYGGTQRPPPRLIWGQNILELNEGRTSAFVGKGIVVRSFDPLTDTMLEAIWPPLGDPLVARKRMPARRASSSSSHTHKPKAAPAEEAILGGEEREEFFYPGIIDPDRLRDIARRIYEERSRQEFEGHVTTREMRVEDVGQGAVDLLTVRAGDEIRVDFAPDCREELKSLGSSQDQIAYLVARGYEQNVAAIMVANMTGMSNLPTSYFVKSASGSLEVDQGGGSFEMRFEYVNRIGLDGAAS